MAECKPERKMTQIVKVKTELDKAVQERMKLSQIYCRHDNRVAVPTAATAASHYYKKSYFDTK